MKLLDLLENVTVKDTVVTVALGGMGYTMYSMYQVVRTIAHIHPESDHASVRSELDHGYENREFGFTRGTN